MTDYFLNFYKNLISLTERIKLHDSIFANCKSAPEKVHYLWTIFPD